MSTHERPYLESVSSRITADSTLTCTRIHRAAITNHDALLSLLRLGLGQIEECLFDVDHGFEKIALERVSLIRIQLRKRHTATINQTLTNPKS
jgi:hypothetical protein